MISKPAVGNFVMERKSFKVESTGDLSFATWQKENPKCIIAQVDTNFRNNTFAVYFWKPTDGNTDNAFY